MTTTHLASLRAADVTEREQAALAELVRTTSGQLRDMLAHVLLAVREGQDLEFLAGRLPVANFEWDGFESQLDLLAATIYNARAQSPREMTPERWAKVKAQFPGSARQCLYQAQAELADL